MNRNLLFSKIGCFGLILALFSCHNPKGITVQPHEVSLPMDAGGILPHLTKSGDKLYLSWLDTSSTDQTRLLYSSLSGDRWSAIKVLASGNNWFVNWADYPMISVNKTHQMSTYLHRPGPAKMAYDIHYNVSPLDNEAQQDYKLLNTDNTATEHGFVSIIPSSDSSFFVTWLDGREMASENHQTHGHAGHHGNTGMQVRVAQVSLQGEITEQHVVDEMACTCCQTTASLTKNGPVVMYRDCTADNIRDIVIVRQVNGKWTKPVPIHMDNWFIEGCPVNGPRSDALGNTLVGAWYTGSNDTPKVQVAFSENSGADFGKPILISEKEVLGRVDITLLDRWHAIVSWMESKGEEAYLYAQAVSKNGKVGEKRLITEISANRKTGFPQMELHANRLYFTWVDLLQGQPQLKMVYFHQDDFGLGDMNR